MAERTSINIIVATGVYTFNHVPFYFLGRCASAQHQRPDAMTEMFIRDITVGIGQTRVRAGILKRATDVPISTHAHVATGAASTSSGSFVRKVWTCRA